MAVIKTYPNGATIHGPPYTEAEIMDFYRRCGPPQAMLRGQKAPTAPASAPIDQQPSPEAPRPPEATPRRP